ncbi:MAG: OmpA family protein [Pseudomonadota bacterium]
MLLASAVILTACAGGGAGPGSQTIYAADVEPTVGRVPTVSASSLPSYAALPANDPTGVAPVPAAAVEAQSPPAEATASAQPHSVVPEPAVAAPVVSRPAVTPAATSPAAAAPVEARPPQVTTQAPAAPTIVRQPVPDRPVVSAPEPAPASVPAPVPAPAEETDVIETVRAVPNPTARPERPTDYPNLADVPGNPGNLPTADETAAIRAELEADRDAINQGETPPSVTDGSIMRIARERLGSLDATAGGTASVTFDAGSSALNLDGLATLQSVALAQRETGSDVRLIGFAYASSETNRPVALGIALDRANAVARALVSYGADPSAISVFANALTDVTQRDLPSSRRVDITLQ